MTSTTWTCAPAGVSGPGVVALRPAADGAVLSGGAVLSARLRHALVRSATPFERTGTAMAAPVAPVQGTGLPTVARIAEPFGAGSGQHITNTRSTLGIHSPGRPQS